MTYLMKIQVINKINGEIGKEYPNVLKKELKIKLESIKTNLNPKYIIKVIDK